MLGCSGGRCGYSHGALQEQEVVVKKGQPGRKGRRDGSQRRRERRAPVQDFPLRLKGAGWARGEVCLPVFLLPSSLAGWLGAAAPLCWLRG
jgi:hypothetical protein